MALRISETITFVADLDAALVFYTLQLGFEVLEREEWGWALIQDAAGVKLGLLVADTWRREELGPNGLPLTRIAMKTTDIEGEVERLREAGVDVTKIVGDANSMRAAHLKDRDGNLIFLWQEAAKK
jgi:catechol 2,3-dioxygenase-like lactoylglutathione lyase family enzyme